MLASDRPGIRHGWAGAEEGDDRVELKARSEQASYSVAAGESRPL
jgi:hypothetical protein